MANLVEKVKSLYEESNAPSLRWLELKNWKLKKNSHWCIAPLIFTGVKEQSNTGL